jgi:hypothetical protein
MPMVKRVPHPYADEIQSFKLSNTLVEEVSILIPKECPPLEETPFLYVDTTYALKTMIDELEGVREIAVDLEYHAY